MGDREKASLRLQFNPQIRLELHGATITSDAGLLAFRELDCRCRIVTRARGLHRLHDLAV